MTRNILPIVRAMTRGSIDSWNSPIAINLCVGPAIVVERAAWRSAG